MHVQINKFFKMTIHYDDMQCNKNTSSSISFLFMAYDII